MNNSFLYVCILDYTRTDKQSKIGIREAGDSLLKSYVRDTKQ